MLLQQGRVATLRLRFVHAAEFVRRGTPCIVRDKSADLEHLGVGVGEVVRCLPLPADSTLAVSAEGREQETA